MKGCVFNVQRYSVHDGPGIRTIVFLKGCPLRCVWCSNPESQKKEPQMAYHEEKCIGGECLMCQRVCRERAIFYPGTGGVRWEKEKCTECGACARVCPAEGFTLWGEWKEARDVIDDVEKDMAFYRRSKGGMTLSGGEPLMQPEFARELLAGAKRRCIHTAVETTLYVEWDQVWDIFGLVDYVLLDIKCLDEERHKQYTGAGCGLVLENFRRLREEFPEKPVKVRTPVVPGFNDRDEDILAIASLVKKYPGTEYELLKYHRFGQNKYGFLGREYAMGDAELEDRRFEHFKSLIGQP